MPTEIEAIAKFITNYGVLVLIGAIFLYVIIRLIKLAFNTLERKMAAKDHEKALDIRTQVSTQIQRLIATVLRDTHATRLHVIEFSNSVMSIAYLPFKYMTCTYEVYKLGASATGHKIDRLSTSLFTPFFAELDEHPYCTFDINDPDTKMGGAMIDLMKAQEEHQALCVALKTPRGKHVGFIELIKEGEFTDTDIAEIQHLGQQVSALLGAVETKQS